jgi:ubiquinone/menaquinone biosynthesis C-methylase UbiE
VRPRYTPEPPDKRAFTAHLDRLYGRTARLFDLTVKLLPTWRRWLDSALPHLRGPRVLEVSFGTGYLLTRYARQHRAHGLELNGPLIETARRNLERAGVEAHLVRGNVEALPYAAGSFDSVLSTMAFSGYPDGARALAELSRVLRCDGVLVLVDVGYPSHGGRLGSLVTRLWEAVGDIIRDLPSLLGAAGFDCVDEEVGGFGSVHLLVCRRRGAKEAQPSPAGTERTETEDEATETRRHGERTGRLSGWCPAPGVGAREADGSAREHGGPLGRLDRS